MRQVKLGEVCEIISGATPKRERIEYWGGTIPWVTPKELSDLESPYLDDSVEKITELGYKSCSSRMLPAESLLFSSRAPIGSIAINRIPVCTNQGFKSFIPSESVDVHYLYYCIKKHVPALQARGNGATFKELPKSSVEEFEIPLPPLDDQKRIAHLLGKVEGLIAQRKQHLQQLDALLKSVFLEMFGDPVKNEKGWETKSILSIAEKITDGEHLNPVFSSDGMPIIMAGNVLEGHVDIDVAKRVDVTQGNRFRKKCNPDKGDILLVSRGATIGRLCRVDTSSPFCLMGSVILFKLSNREIDSAFLTYLLKHPRMYAKLFNSSGSSAQQAIYLKDVKNLICIVPPSDLQNQFAAIVEKVEGIKSSYQQSLADLEALYGTLSQKAFAGELDLSRVSL